MGKIINSNEAEFQGIIDSETNIVIVDFWAEWCGPCRVLEPILEEVSRETEDVTIVKVNVDDNPSLSAKYGIRSIPAILSFKEGEMINKIIGAKPKNEIIDFINDSKNGK